MRAPSDSSCDAKLPPVKRSAVDESSSVGAEETKAETALRRDRALRRGDHGSAPTPHTLNVFRGTHTQPQHSLPLASLPIPPPRQSHAAHPSPPLRTSSTLALATTRSAQSPTPRRSRRTACSAADPKWDDHRRHDHHAAEDDRWAAAPAAVAVAPAEAAAASASAACQRAGPASLGWAAQAGVPGAAAAAA